MQLREIGDEIWVGDGDLSPMGTHFGTRMTVVRCPSGKLAVHSVVPAYPQMKAELSQLGGVGYFLAPNLFHHSFLSDALQMFPDARLYGVPGLAKKRKDLKFTGELTPDLPDELGSVFEAVAYGGTLMFNELAMFHKKSKSLIVTDLVFNYGPTEHWWSRNYRKMFQVNKRLASSRLMRAMTKDPAALRVSVDEILKWDFERVCLTHGEVAENTGPDQFSEALSWVQS
ncbi:MAG: DUF4336 domain-containing protein [Polyangiaceae bacterium]|nr:DUF4336 domain-containing protein [Polyangiaceae bacterium]